MKISKRPDQNLAVLAVLENFLAGQKRQKRPDQNLAVSGRFQQKIVQWEKKNRACGAKHLKYVSRKIIPNSVLYPASVNPINSYKTVI